MCNVTRSITVVAVLAALVMTGGDAMAESSDPAAPRADVNTYPAPEGVVASTRYAVEMDGRSVFIHETQAVNGGTAAFGSFDFRGTVAVAVRMTRPAGAPAPDVKIRPLSWGITPRVQGDTVHFTLDQPRHVTLEVDGFDHALHLFANPIDDEPVDPCDPAVIYFGPGVHDIETFDLRSGQTLYLAGGAVLRCRLIPGEKPREEKNWAGQKVYRHLVTAADADGVRIRGRGVIDMSQLPWHARSGIMIVRSRDVLIEGITIVDAPAWNIATFECTDVRVENVKLLGHRLNSDGVNLCNTQRGRVTRCFSRTNDDAFSVKTTRPAPAQPSADIVVTDCVVWNERARGIGITSETRRDINDVTFRNIDIIRDFANKPEWLCAAMAVLVSDSGTMRGITFEDIRIEHSEGTLFRGWIGSDMWGHDKTRGHVDGLTFRQVQYVGGGRPILQFDGFNAEHRFRNVTLDHVTIAGREVGPDSDLVKLNPHVDPPTFLTSSQPAPP